MDIERRNWTDHDKDGSQHLTEELPGFPLLEQELTRESIFLFAQWCLGQGYTQPLTGCAAGAIQTDVPLAAVLIQDEMAVMTESINFSHQFESHPNAADRGTFL